MDTPKQPELPLDIPEEIKRDPVTNRAPFMSTEVIETEVKAPKAKTAKVKANGKEAPKATKKAAAKPKAEKSAKAKTAKGSEKTKAAKPKAVSKVEKDMYGLRKGSARSKAAAMYARKSGATLDEVKESVGSIQLNVLNELEGAGWVVEKEKQKVDGSRPVNRYWLKPAK